MFKRTDNTYPSDIRQLTSLRFFAALIIVIFHFCQILPFKITITDLPGKGYLAVDFFFMLSGFILSHVYLNEIEERRFHARDFYIRRLGRIYPVHLFTLVVTVFLLLLSYKLDPADGLPKYFSAGTLLTNIMLVHGWGWNETAIFSFNRLSWSVSAEWFAYLLFPLSAFFLQRIRGGILLCFSLFFFFGLSLLTRHILDEPLPQTTFGLLRILPEFLSGMALYRIGRRYSLKHCGQFTLMACVTAILLLMHFGAPDELIVLSFGLLILVAAEQAREGVGGLLTSPITIWLGQISYSLYMVHFILRENVFLFFSGFFYGTHVDSSHVAIPLDAFYPLYFATLALCLPVAALCYHFIEQPSRHWITRRFARTPAKPANGRIIEWFQTSLPKPCEMIPYLLLAAAILAAYANVYKNAFVSDDLWIIVHNGFLRHWSNLPDLLLGPGFQGGGWKTGFFRPVLMLLYFFTYQAFGLWTPAFHGLNIALHIANTGLVYGLGRRLGLKPGVSFGAALLWAVHPVHTEAVAFVSALGDPLYSFFCLLGLLVLLPDFAPRKFWLAGLIFILALASKEQAVVFPALVTVTMFLASKERLRPALYLRTWPLWLLAAVYVVLWLMYFHAGNSPMEESQDPVFLGIYAHNLTNRILTCLATLHLYLGMMIWPTDLHFERSYPVFGTLWTWQVLTGAAMVAGVILQIVWGQARRGLAFSWGFLWFAAAYSPSAGIAVPVDAIVAEHWMYLPTIGIAVGIAQTVADCLDGKRQNVRVAAAVLVTVIAMALGIKTYHQNTVWHDSASLYEDILRYGEESGRAHLNLGLFYSGQGEFDKASQQFRMAIAHPTPLPQSMIPVLHFDLALAYLRDKPDENDMVTLKALRQVLPFSSQTAEAIEEMHKALELDPEFYWANKFLAVIYAYQGDDGKAFLFDRRAEAASQNMSR
jgi:peptidoglycan/LPS O-acetylase OafA/YrhL/tetratricopeptide (TPR) repeat protein